MQRQTSLAAAAWEGDDQTYERVLQEAYDNLKEEVVNDEAAICSARWQTL